MAPTKIKKRHPPCPTLPKSGVSDAHEAVKVFTVAHTNNATSLSINTYTAESSGFSWPATQTSSPGRRKAISVTNAVCQRSAFFVAFVRSASARWSVTAMHRFVAAVLRLVVALVSGWWARFYLRFRSPSAICTVTIGPGKLRGVTVTAKGYHYFKGIRYAEPPIGDLRFKVTFKDGPSPLLENSFNSSDLPILQPPVPLKTFAQPVVDCFVEGSRCIQYDQILKVLIGSEDGLFLNVYTPELPGSGQQDHPNLPVMVYIHGGGFLCGNGDAFLYDPVHFVQRRVVIVTFNYRLGPLGFLCFPEAGVPGNAGLKDQLLVLRWVRDHIAAFGGNPDNVTLFGESAGAKAAYLHYLSPVSRYSALSTLSHCTCVNA